MRRRFAALWAGACAAALGSAAAAPSWHPVGDSAQGDLYLDTSAIARLTQGDEYLEIRTLLVYRVPLASGATRALMRGVVNCERLTQRTLLTEWFDEQGRPRGRRVDHPSPEQAIASMRGERNEYSAGLAGLCASISAHAARGGLRQAGSADIAPGASIRSAPLLTGGGVYGVRAKLNGALDVVMAVDSGAALCQISWALAQHLRRGGSLSDADALGSGRFVTADGRGSVKQVVRLRSVEIGGHVVRDVEASIAETGDTLLLGQSYLGRLRHWSLNRSRQAFEFVP